MPAYKSAYVSILATSLLLAGCDKAGELNATARARSEEKVLHVYNWADYVGESTVAEF